MSRAGARVGVGTHFRYDGETVEVVEMAATTEAAPGEWTPDHAATRVSVRDWVRCCSNSIGVR